MSDHLRLFAYGLQRAYPIGALCSCRGQRGAHTTMSGVEDAVTSSPFFKKTWRGMLAGDQPIQPAFPVSPRLQKNRDAELFLDGDSTKIIFNHLVIRFFPDGKSLKTSIIEAAIRNVLTRLYDVQVP